MFRIAATVLAVYLIRLILVKLLGALYLLYLTYSHFWGHENQADRTRGAKSQAVARPVSVLGHRRAGSS